VQYLPRSIAGALVGAILARPTTLSIPSWRIGQVYYFELMGLRFESAIDLSS
jgi:hypothetical protein